MTTKEKLIASALKLFNKNGFENTSTTSICRDAGFSSGALFVHFKTKNELLDYVYIYIKRNYFDFVFGEMSDELNTRELLELVIEKSFVYFLHNYEEFVFMESFATSNHISRIAKEQIEFESKAFTKIINKAKREGIVSNIENDLLFASMTGAFYSLVKVAKQKNAKKLKKYMDLVLKTILK